MTIRLFSNDTKEAASAVAAEMLDTLIKEYPDTPLTAEAWDYDRTRIIAFLNDVQPEGVAMNMRSYRTSTTRSIE